MQSNGVVPVPSPWGPGAIILRLLSAAILTTAIVLLGIAGLSVTTAPEWLSLTLEPLSLLLTPGVFLGLFATRQHDYSQRAVLETSIFFYLGVSFALLSLLAHRQARANSQQRRSER